MTLNPRLVAIQGIGFTPIQVAVQGLIEFIEDGGKTTYAGEIDLGSSRKWYVRRKKQILVFQTAQEADDYLDAEKAAQEAIDKAQKTSRRARKRLRDKILAKPKAIDLDQLESLAERYSFTVDLPQLVLNQDYERLLYLYQQALELQEEEDIEVLLSLY